MKEKLIKTLINKKELFNRYSKICYLKNIKIDLSYADLRSANLRSAELDFSCLDLSCNSLSAKFDKKHIIQILYHASKPCENNKLSLDCDIEKLFASKMFKKVVNKFHRIEETGRFVYEK